MNKISDITRQDILDIIKDGFVSKAGDPLTENAIYMPYYGRLDEIAFLTRLYDLRALPSHDNRYQDALGDISCHIKWGDYEDCWFFQDRRFKLLPSDGDEPLLSFICEMLHPAVRIENSAWRDYLEKFNELLRVDGYELFAAQHVSGREIYKAREYRGEVVSCLENNLFSVRYKELIQWGNGTPIDNISGSIAYSTKKHICDVLYEFDEPMRIQPNRYNSYTVNTSAADEAIRRFNGFMGMPVIDMDKAIFSPATPEEYLADCFTPFLFDIIELQFDELSTSEKSPFQAAINASFQKENVPFKLSDRGLIEPDENYDVLSSEIVSSIDAVVEPGIRDLLNEAIEKHRQPSFEAHRDAVEKLWDAFERLKTYYTDRDKKASAEKIVKDMANNRQEYIKLFDDEFTALRIIGNSFRIRHHETDKIDITDIRHYDYFFNRCLALIAAAIQYLEQNP